jgi:Flp pilus assembly protein CpaB
VLLRCGTGRWQSALADAVLLPRRLRWGVSWRDAVVVEARSGLMTSTVAPRSAARLRRLDLRVVIGLALLLAGVVGTVGVVQRAGQRTPVLVMAHDVPAGQVIDAQDVRVAELGLAPGVAALGIQDRGRVVGQIASTALAAGQVLGPTAIAGAPPLEAGQALMSVAVAPEHAAAGTLRAGDQVAVVASSSPDQPTAGRAEVLLSPVPVVAVRATTEAAGGDGKLLVSLAIPEAQAPALAQATHGTVDLVLLARVDR